MTDGAASDEASPIDGHLDHDVAWAMQFAIRYDKADPASHVDTCEAVARAAVALISSPEAREGDWQERVEYWRDGRIRKLVRRAKGATRWAEAQLLAGVTIEQGGDGEGVAAARAYVPGPVRPLDPILKKLREEANQQIKLEYEKSFMFFVPRICEHCLNPSYMASSPSGAIYKRSEDGIVLVDQDK